MISENLNNLNQLVQTKQGKLRSKVTGQLALKQDRGVRVPKLVQDKTVSSWAVIGRKIKGGGL